MNVIKNISVLFLLFTINVVVSQTNTNITNRKGSFTIKSGINITKFEYKSPMGSNADAKNIQSDNGNWYFLGYTTPVLDSGKNKNNLKYEVGVSLGDYNSVLGIKSSYYNWKTLYAEVGNSLLFSIINTKKISVSPKVGFNVATLLQGKEEINGVVYDLKQADGFRGLTLQSVLGIQTTLFASNITSVSAGYDYVYSLNFTNHNLENLSLNTNRIWFGLNFKIN